MSRLALVTGATGFIGGRLVETLAADGAELRVLVRDLSKGSRVGRFPVDFAQGDLGDADAVRAAVDGADLVFHCAYGNSGDEAAMRRTTVDGTRHVAEAARDAGARLVHVSTVAVYGAVGAGMLDESVPHDPDGDFYAETKHEAEQLVLDLARKGDLAASVVQPTVVYGPYAPAWTVRILDELKTGRVILIGEGDGLCNVVYVDDVVRGLRLAATRDEAVGEAFLISGAEPVTWRTFYAGYERMLGFQSHVEMTAGEARDLFERLYGKRRFVSESLSLVRESPDMRHRIKQTREIQAFVRAAKMVVPGGVRRTLKAKLTGRHLGPPASAPKPAQTAKPIHPLPPAGIELGRSRTRVSIDKARSLLGYEPAFDWEAGMQRVEDWARWAGLLDGSAESAVG